MDPSGGRISTLQSHRRNARPELGADAPLAQSSRTARLAVLAVLCLLGSGCEDAADDDTPAQRPPPAAPPAAEAPADRSLPSPRTLDEARQLAERTWEQVREAYEDARSAGEGVPEGVVEWTAEDIRRIGDWEYNVETLAPAEPAQVVERLNQLGEDRWEAYWQERSPDGESLTVYLKRPARSYLRHVPVGDLLRFVPGGNTE